MDSEQSFKGFVERRNAELARRAALHQRILVGDWVLFRYRLNHFVERVTRKTAKTLYYQVAGSERKINGEPLTIVTEEEAAEYQALAKAVGQKVREIRAQADADATAAREPIVALRARLTQKER